MMRENKIIAGLDDALAYAQGDKSRGRETTVTPMADIHSDDAAVDRFAAMMKAKLAKARAKGRGGWDNPDPDNGGCTAAFLAECLQAHIRKGDPVDVANFCMFLHLRGADTFGAMHVPAEQ